MSNVLPLGLLVLLEAVLPQVGDHAPIVKLGGPLPPQGNVLPTIVAPSNARSSPTVEWLLGPCWFDKHLAFTSLCCIIFIFYHRA